MIGDEMLDGPSIGFVARDRTPRVVRVREPRRIELREISLVTAPMLREARVSVPGDAITTRARRAI